MAKIQKFTGVSKYPVSAPKVKKTADDFDLNALDQFIQNQTQYRKIKRTKTQWLKVRAQIKKNFNKTKTLVSRNKFVLPSEASLIDEDRGIFYVGNNGKVYNSLDKEPPQQIKDSYSIKIDYTPPL